MADENLNVPNRQGSQRKVFVAVAIFLVLAAGGGGLAYYNKIQQQKMDDLAREQKEALAAVQQQLALEQQQKQQAEQELEKEKQEQALAQEQLDRTSQALTEAQKPDIPLTITKRSGLVASGYVVTFRNSSSEPLAVRVVLGRQSTGASRQFDMVINANGVKEIGELEGWAFVPGDSIGIYKNGSKPIETTVGN